MPWSSGEAKAKTHKANTPKKREVWAKVANATLSRTGDDGRAVREANAVVSRMKKGKK